jgi:hypothetical protein
MWIILLDRSGSMGDPFAATDAHRPPGRVRVTEAASKWLAAKEAVLDEVSGLDPAEAVCLIAFNTEAPVVFEGRAGEAAQLRSVLDALAPSGGTDVAAALDAAGEQMARRGTDATTSVEVVSDGLSDLAKAQAAAVKLGTRAGRIDVVLIDPTPEGQAVARAVAVRGRVFSVSSASELKHDTGEAASRHLAEQERLRGALARIEEARNATLAAVPAPERLAMTAGYPGEPLTGLWYPLTLYLHVAAMRDEVRRRMDARGRRLGVPLDEVTARLTLIRGTWLTLTPRCDGVTFNPASQEVAWYEDVQEVAFRFYVSPEVAGQLLSGSIEACTAEGLPIARLGLSLRVRGAESTEEEAWATVETEMFRSIFASYAHVDGAIVRRCAAAYRALGIEMFIDRDSLLAGQAWHPALLSLVDQADVFQLYWSEPAKLSAEVEKEWRHALTQRGAKGERFIRGVFWTTPMPKPPEALRDTHFGFLDLAAVEAKEPRPEADAREDKPPETGQGATILSPAQEERRAQELTPVVLPLVAGETRRSLARRRRDVASAVAFLESMTGLRHNEVPTILVDELLVREVRRRMAVVDDPPPVHADPQARAALEVWGKLLQAQLLDFHVRKVPPSACTDGSHASVPPLPSGISEELFTALKGLAEGALTKWLREFSTFPWRDQQMFGDAPERHLPDLLSARVVATLDRNLATAKRSRAANSAQVRQLRFRRETSSPLYGFDEGLAWESVRTEPFLAELRGCEQTTDRAFSLAAPVAVLVRALAAIRDELSAALPTHDDCRYTAASGPNVAAARCLSLAICAGAILEELYYELPDADRVWSDRWLGDLVAGIVYPDWRRTRDLLRVLGVASMREDLDLRSFVAAYLDLMLVLFRHGLEQSPGHHWSDGYAIPAEAWEVVERELRPSRITARKPDRAWRREDDERVMEAPFAAFVELFEAGACKLLAALNRVAPRRACRARLVEEALDVAAHGIFVPAANGAADAALAAWAVRRNIAPQAALPDMPRVLFRTSTSPSPEDSTRRRLLERCTLVHEHFHAIVETGLDTRFLAARAPRQDPSAWKRATALNEALAAWMEVHFLRRHAASLGEVEEVAEAQNAVWAYVRSGEYPSWPYRGAEAVEALYAKGGTDAIQGLIHRLRDDPEGALELFEAQMQ